MKASWEVLASAAGNRCGRLLIRFPSPGPAPHRSAAYGLDLRAADTNSPG
jgi:hypothetical protein